MNATSGDQIQGKLCMDNSFEERLARINAKSAQSGSTLNQPTCAPPQQPPRRKGASSPLKLLLLSFVGGLVVIGGMSFALPRLLADNSVQVFAAGSE